MGEVSQADVRGQALTSASCRSATAASLAGWRGALGGGGWHAVVGGWRGGWGGGAEEVEAESDDQKTSTHMIVQKSIKLIPLPNKQEMVSHVVKPKSSRTPKQSPQASAASRQRGRVGLTKGAWEQAESGRQELEANLSGLFVKLGVEK